MTPKKTVSFARSICWLVLLGDDYEKIVTKMSISLKHLILICAMKKTKQ